MKTADDIALSLAKAAALYDVKLSAARMAAYLDVLASAASPAEICAGIESACRRSKWFPSAAEILESCGRSPAVEGAEAWARALEVSAAGRHRNRDGDVPDATRRAVRLLGGWDVIALCHESRRHFVERRFLEIYRGVASGVDAAAVVCEAGSKEITKP